MADEEAYFQGDERGQSVDFFDPMSPTERLHESFKTVAGLEKFSPARGIIEPMMRWYEDLDGNFVEQFQTTGFDARVWELYLFATFVEMGYRIAHVHAVPDFACEGLLGDFTVEAMTVNPTQEKDGSNAPLPSLDTQEQLRAFQSHYMPIKFAGPLTSKLKKRYWEKPAAKGKPLLFAIQNFSIPAAAPSGSPALPIYLYGVDLDWRTQEDGGIAYAPRPIEEHRWGRKVIPAAFFSLPEAENVSAVVFNKSGTISKFNRMGVLGGFGSGKVVLFRHGLVFDYHPHALVPHHFAHVVNAPGYAETWVEGLEVFHNPRALRPLEPTLLPGATHWLFNDGEMQSSGEGFLPLDSLTFSAVVKTTEEAKRLIDHLIPLQKGLDLKRPG